MPQSVNVIGSTVVDKNDQLKPEEVVQEIYFGIFFDGTNNNKLQVMLGKRYRRDACLKQVISRIRNRELSWEQVQSLQKCGIVPDKVALINKYPNPDDRDHSQLVTLNQEIYGRNDQTIIFPNGINGNAIVEQKPDFWKGILTQSEIDELYFGYNSEDKDNYFIEKRISNQLDDSDHSPGDDTRSSDKIGWDRSEATEHFSFASPKADVDKKIIEDADSMIEGKTEGATSTHFVSPSQSSTYTNVAILESLYDASIGMNTADSVTRKYYSIYVEGSGADMDFRSIPAYLHLLGSGLFGLGKGTGGSGTVAKVRKVSAKVSSILKGFEKSPNVKLSFDIFGFSRGAAAARMYTYLLNPQEDLKPKLKAVYDEPAWEGPSFRGPSRNDYELLSGKQDVYLGKFNRKIRFLGIFDTVSSIGVFRDNWLISNFKVGIVNALGGIGQGLDSVINKTRDIFGGEKLKDMEEPDVSVFGKSKYHDQNVHDYGLYATNQAEDTFHICALDELRSNFALVDIQSSIDDEKGTELFIPGCHTDIGGGCGLGRDNVKIANISSANGTPNYISWVNPFDIDKMQYVPLSAYGLMLAGWISPNPEKSTWANGSFFKANRPTGKELKSTHWTVFTDNSDSWLHNKNIIMSRYVKPGYSNIGLNLMAEKANHPVGRKMFKDIPLSYQVPEGLKSYYSVISGKVINNKGRYFVTPSKGAYSELRTNWLHFSSNDQIVDVADNIIVNPPNYVEAYYNDTSTADEITKDSLILDGKTVNLKLQEHKFSKVISNVKNNVLALDLSQSLLDFYKVKGIVFNMADAMLATRIIYSGIDGDRDGQKTRSYLLNNYHEKSLIPWQGENVDMSALISCLKKEAKTLRSYIELCHRIRESLSAQVDEELFNILVNTTKLAANNAKIFEIQTVPTNIEKGLIVDIPQTLLEQKVASVGLATASSVSPMPNKYKNGFARLTVKGLINGEFTFGDLMLVDVLEDQERKCLGYSEEASTWFIENWEQAVNSVSAVLPSKYEKSHWAIWILLNSPEIGKIFGHTAGLISILNTKSDWKREEDHARTRLRVVNKQLEQLIKEGGASSKSNKHPLDCMVSQQDGNLIICQKNE